MAFTGEQPGRGIQADPTGAGQIHFAPGVQVGEVHLGTGRAIEGFDVGGELDQVTETNRAANPRLRSNCTNNQAESRHEPDAFSRVNSGVCTPGSMRIR